MAGSCKELSTSRSSRERDGLRFSTIRIDTALPGLAVASDSLRR
jgi:hypothetical protein